MSAKSVGTTATVTVDALSIDAIVVILTKSVTAMDPQELGSQHLGVVVISQSGRSLEF